VIPLAVSAYARAHFTDCTTFQGESELALFLALFPSFAPVRGRPLAIANGLVGF
jgi:hypothetical protein